MGPLCPIRSSCFSAAAARTDLSDSSQRRRWRSRGSRSLSPLPLHKGRDRCLPVVEANWSFDRSRKNRSRGEKRRIDGFRCRNFTASLIDAALESSARPSVLAGVLRLRGNFASRSFHFAQDDSDFLDGVWRGQKFRSFHDLGFLGAAAADLSSTRASIRASARASRRATSARSAAASSSSDDFIA
jgi:hypothetical protein